MLDGAARVEKLAQEVAQSGDGAIAMTDHGNVFGAFDFYKTMKKAGVKPIIGIEAYVAPESRFDKKRVKWAEGGEDDVSAGGAYTHMTILAENNVGLSNLFKLSSLASLEGFYYKPRMDKEILAQYSQGLIATTGCPGGEIQTRIRMGAYNEARAAAAAYRDIFGADNYFVEIMDHGIEIEQRVKDDLLKLAKELGLPLLATNDLHYTYAADSKHHEALLCIQTGSTLAEGKRFKFDSNEYYLKDAATMRRIFKDIESACDNTLLIAERCDVTLRENENLLPKFPVPSGETEDSWLVKEAERGLATKFPDGITEEHKARLHYELGVMTKMGFAGYFLVVADLVAYAKSQGIRVGPGRGSAAGSLVSYVLGITALDPIAHGLLFERFLNPERISMPDIDLDFDERQQTNLSSLRDRYTKIQKSFFEQAGGAQSMAYQQVRREVFRDYDAMDNDPILASALDIYADESTLKNEFGDTLLVSSENQQVQDVLNNLFYDILNIEFNLWPWVRNMCKYGDFFLGLEIAEGKGIVNVTAISPKGLTTFVWISHEILEVNTVVLPLPAPAKIRADSF